MQAVSGSRGCKPKTKIDDGNKLLICKFVSVLQSSLVEADLLNKIIGAMDSVSTLHAF